MSSAALLFFGALFATIFLQNSPSQSKTSASSESQSLRPNAELELDSLDQVQEINEHNFKIYEIHSSDDSRE